jgi:hypothetical protein
MTPTRPEPAKKMRKSGEKTIPSMIIATNLRQKPA